MRLRGRCARHQHYYPNLATTTNAKLITHQKASNHLHAKHPHPPQIAMNHISHLLYFLNHTLFVFAYISLLSLLVHHTLIISTMPKIKNQSITTRPNAVQKPIKLERVGWLSKPLSRQKPTSCLAICEGSKASSRQFKSVDGQCVCPCWTVV